MIFGKINLFYIFVFKNTLLTVTETYPMLHDVANRKHYVGFESIYEYSRTLQVSILFSYQRIK